MLSYRWRFAPLALLLLLPLAVACEREPEPTPADTPPAAVDEATPPADVATAFDRYIAAWNGADPAAVGRFFTADATATVGEESYDGREEIVAEWVQPVQPDIRDLQIVELVSERDGDDHVTRGTYVGTSPDGEAFSGSYSATWTLDEDGQWRISESDVQPDAPPEAAPDATPEG